MIHVSRTQVGGTPRDVGTALNAGRVDGRVLHADPPTSTWI